MPDLSPIVDVVGTLVGPAVKTLLQTTLGAVVLTVVVGGACVVVAANGSWLRGALGAAVALVLGLSVGGLLALKRSVVEALSVGLRRLGLGRRTLGALIQRLAAVGDDDEWKERGGARVQTVERLPLAQAETRLRSAVAAMTDDTARLTGFRGWLARRIERTLLQYVEMLTLARFRDSAAAEGGIDVLRVRDELSAHIDELIVSALQKMMFKLTAGMILGATIAALVASLGVRLASL